MKKKIILSMLVLSCYMSFGQQWSALSGNLYNDPLTTKIGIGTETPISLLHLNGTAGNEDMFSMSYTASGTLWNYMTMGYNNNPYISFNTKLQGGIEYIDDGSYKATAAKMHYDFSGLQFDTYKHPTNQQGAPLPTWTPVNQAGWQRTLTLRPNGKVSIGRLHVNSGPHWDYALSVDGNIVAKGFTATILNWADYVFMDDYELTPLEDVEKFIEKNKHLPNVPSENELKVKGVEISKMLTIQMEKIEELTLYIIQLNNELEIAKKEIEYIKQNGNDK